MLRMTRLCEVAMLCETAGVDVIASAECDLHSACCAGVRVITVDHAVLDRDCSDISMSPLLGHHCSRHGFDFVGFPR